MSDGVFTVYLYSDEFDRLLYVGVTGRGIQRSSEHSRSASWWSEVSHARFEQYPTAEEALDAERKYIRTLLPIHNRDHNPWYAACERSKAKFLACVEAGVPFYNDEPFDFDAPRLEEAESA